ncbi:MAG: 2,3-bisphosphoglycerate-independent phosphoglycerate mutase [Candidatus Woesearchaeota archaeon]
MKQACLIVLDGWGIAPPGPGNAIASAQPRRFNALWQDNPHTMLDASGTAVGLLPGFIGNSEVGHLHLGAGRLIKQDLARIMDSIKDGSFYKNKVLLQAMKRKTVHLLGLVSDGGVHSHINHLLALIRMADWCKVKNLYVHAITDGRDVPPKSAIPYLKKVEKELARHNKNWKIATIIGRYYAMDRDNRWNREHKAYDAMVNGIGHRHKTPETAVQEAYNRGETDEFIYPTIIEPEGLVKPGDSIIFFNFRSDRARELTRAFVQGRFNKFKRKKIINLFFVCLTQYDPAIKAPVAFPPEYIKNTLGEVISKHNLRQFRLAETEKWAHVTFFFNGLSGTIFKNEDRLLIPSPKVSTYDKTPEMSAFQITKKALEILQSKKYGFVLINFANPDMVGHTGRIDATIQAIKAVDECLGYVVTAAQNNGYDIIITADHGKAEEMLYPDGTVCTAHTTNKVPFILVSAQKHRLRKIKRPALYHVAPTILQLIGIERPKEMEPGLLR